MKKTLFFTLFLVIGIVLLAQLIFETGPELIVARIMDFGLSAFVLFTVISTTNFILYVWRWHVIVKAHGYHVPLWQLFCYRMMGYMVSYLTPVKQMGGEPLRVYFLHKHDIPLKEATSTVIIDTFLDLATVILFIFIGVGIYISTGFLLGDQFWVLLGSFVAIVLLVILFTYLTVSGKGFFSSLLGWFGLYRFRPLKSYQEKIFLMEQRMHHFFVKRWKSLAFTIFLSFVMNIVIVLEFWLLLHFLGTSISFGQAFIMSTLPSISYFVPIPGAVGVLEGAQVATFSLMGIDPKLGLVVVMILRLRDIVFLLFGMGAAGFYGFGNLKKQLQVMWKRGE